MNRFATTAALFALLCAAPSTGCKSMYYGTLERFGVQKRHILVDRVEEGREAQEEAKKQFESALEAFRAVTAVDGGDLEDVYDRLKREFEKSESRVENVQGRVKRIEEVSTDLFSEWNKEIQQIQNSELARKSLNQLEETRRRYEGLIGAMKTAESKMQPVLTSFRDHVLYLKHNLNARAIASLQDELTVIEDEVGVLIRDMEASIAEADAFIATMEGEEG